MTIMLENLIAEYESAVSQIDRQIEYLNNGGRILPIGEDPEVATAKWLAKLKGFRTEYLTLTATLRQAQRGQADQPAEVAKFCKRAMAGGQSGLGALEEARKHFGSLEWGAIEVSGERAAIRLPGGMYVSYEGSEDGWRTLAGRPSWL